MGLHKDKVNPSMKLYKVIVELDNGVRYYKMVHLVKAHDEHEAYQYLGAHYHKDRTDIVNCKMKEITVDYEEGEVPEDIPAGIII